MVVNGLIEMVVSDALAVAGMLGSVGVVDA